MLKKVKEFSHRLPDKKRYFEFITALLTIPVMLTVLITNLNNINSQKALQKQTQTVPSPTAVQPQITKAAEKQSTSASGKPLTPTPTPDPVQCKREIGPVSIVNPEQNETVTADPVCIDIAREGTNYCAVVWSYRINGGAWSDFTDKSICLYSLSPGSKHLELRVKSVVTGGERVMERTFSVADTAISPTPIVSTSSAILQTESQ